jgi:hypothetical protein
LFAPRSAFELAQNVIQMFDQLLNSTARSQTLTARSTIKIEPGVEIDGECHAA